MATSTAQSQKPGTTGKTSSRVATATAVLLLALMFVLAGGAALRESVTFDEVAHIGAGLSYWQKLDMRFNEEHPPLAKLIAAVPLALQPTHADYSHLSWTQSVEFFPAFVGQWIFGEYLLNRWNQQPHILAWARFPMLLLTLALGWIIFVIGRRLAGPWGGVIAVAAYATAPVFLAFGPLVLTDIAITLFSLLSLWTFAELWQEPSKKNTRLFALALAAALLSKFSAGMLLFAFLGVSLSTRWLPVPGQPDNKLEAKLWRKTRWRALFKAILWAAGIVYVVYFVLSINQPPPLFHGVLAATVGRLLMPPLLYLRGLLLLLIMFSRPAFILGHTYPHGVWFYFPVLFLLKSSSGFLGLTALAGTIAFYAKRKKIDSIIPAELRIHWRVLWVSLIVFTALCMLSHLNVCYRHFSIPIVLLTIMLAPLAILVQRLRINAPRIAAATVVATVLLAGTCVFTVARQYPYYFPYTSVLAFGRPAYTLMSDANVDWNQSLPDVARFASSHGLQRLKIDEYGFTMSSATVPGSDLWDCQNPDSEDAGRWVVVSANEIMDTHNCTWLMQYPHEVLAAGSMYAVRLPQPVPPAGSPGGPPLFSDRRLFLQMADRDMRMMFQELIRNPESLPRFMDEMAQHYAKARSQAK